MPTDYLGNTTQPGSGYRSPAATTPANTPGVKPPTFTGTPSTGRSGAYAAWQALMQRRQQMGGQQPGRVYAQQQAQPGTFVGTPQNSMAALPPGQTSFTPIQQSGPGGVLPGGVLSGGGTMGTNGQASGFGMPTPSVPIQTAPPYSPQPTGPMSIPGNPNWSGPSMAPPLPGGGGSNQNPTGTTRMQDYDATDADSQFVRSRASDPEIQRLWAGYQRLRLGTGGTQNLQGAAEMLAEIRSRASQPQPAEQPYQNPIHELPGGGQPVGMQIPPATNPTGDPNAGVVKPAGMEALDPNRATVNGQYYSTPTDRNALHGGPPAPGWTWRDNGTPGGDWAPPGYQPPPTGPSGVPTLSSPPTVNYGPQGPEQGFGRPDATDADNAFVHGAGANNPDVQKAWAAYKAQYNAGHMEQAGDLLKQVRWFASQPPATVIPHEGFGPRDEVQTGTGPGEPGPGPTPTPIAPHQGLDRVEEPLQPTQGAGGSGRVVTPPPAAAPQITPVNGPTNPPILAGQTSAQLRAQMDAALKRGDMASFVQLQQAWERAPQGYTSPAAA